MMAPIGSLEYRALIDNHQAIYWKLPEDYAEVVRGNQFAAEETLRLFLGLFCRAILHALWLVKDNAVNCDTGFLWYPRPLGQTDHASNYLPSLNRTHKGELDVTAFSELEIKLARTYFEEHVIDMMTSGWDPTRPETAPVKRPISHKSVPRLARAQSFAFSARETDDLGKKISLYMTCMEVIFSRDSSELAHKLSERVALFVGQDGGSKREVFRLMKRAYGIRSKVLHGDHLSASDERELAFVSEKADALLRQIFRRLFDDPSVRIVHEGSREDLDEYFASLMFGSPGSDD